MSCCTATLSAPCLAEAQHSCINPAHFESVHVAPLGFVPIVISGLQSHAVPSGQGLWLRAQGAPTFTLFSQGSGSEFWQTNFDRESGTYEIVYNVEFRHVSTTVAFGSDPDTWTSLPPVTLPPPPSPPPPPPPLSPPASFAVTVEVALAASVSDLTEDVLTAMRQKVANEVGVALAAVSATATAASVLVAFTVNFQTEAAADAALPALSTALSDPAAASVFLTTAELTVTVETVIALPAKLVLASPPHAPPPSTLPPVSSSSPAVDAAVIGGAVGGAAAILLAAGCFCAGQAKHSARNRIGHYEAQKGGTVRTN